MNQEPPSKTWIAILGATAIIIAAIIGLGVPFAENLANRYLPPFTPTTLFIPPSPQIVVVTATSPSQLVYPPTAIPFQDQPVINTPQAASQQPSGICQEAGGPSGFPLPPKPSAPANGCVLIVEWWVPPDTSNCGILITTREPVVPDDSIGAWWYVYPQRPESHKQEYLAKNPQCKVEDQR